MKLSLVIPTRARANYLRSCLVSATRAADKAGCDVEIVVSDNASEDETADVVAAMAHPAIRYFRLPGRVSMRANFEAALGFATGSHVVFIGDDDGVLPHGLWALRDLIATTDADVINWRVLNFEWPDAERGLEGHLKLRPLQMSGRIRRIDPSARLRDIGRAQFSNYHDGAVVYHGCIARRVFDRVLSAGRAPYFRTASPDVYASFLNLMLADTDSIKIDTPITLGGASPRSNGAAGQRAADVTKLPTTSEYARFIQESASDPFLGRVPATCPSISLHCLDALLLAAKVSGTEVAIDWAAWQKRIAREVRHHLPAVQAHCAEVAARAFDVPVIIPVVQTDPPNDASSAVGADPVPDQRSGRRRGGRFDFHGGPAMADISSASAFLDDLAALDEFEVTNGGILPSAARVVRLWHRLNRALVAS